MLNKKQENKKNLDIMVCCNEKMKKSASGNIFNDEYVVNRLVLFGRCETLINCCIVFLCYVNKFLHIHAQIGK